MANASGKVLLVGSINLYTVDDVFRTAGGILGPLLRRIPDGEPGPRRAWIGFNQPTLVGLELLEPDPTIRTHTGTVPLRLRAETAPEAIIFGELGYAREAKGSYVDFKAAQRAGTIPASCRFQVCLPTPLAVMSAFIALDSRAVVDAAFETAMIAEIERIAEAGPHGDLAIQLDICHDMLAWDGRGALAGAKAKPEIVSQLARLADAVPSDVELGLHLCYGDFRGRHFVEPADTGKLTEFANALAAAIRRPITWIHMPVPESRADDSYFAPLKDLSLNRDTELYLGLVHLADGAAGTRSRMAAARKFVADFGIATECGMGRKWRPAEIPALMRLHAEMARG